MRQKNIFDGDSIRAQFTNIIYQKLINRELFSHADVMAKYCGYENASDLPFQVTYCTIKDKDKDIPLYPELKKAFCKLRKELGKNAVKEYGNNRNKKFLYVGESDDPLSDLRNAKVINDLKQYFQFCQDSAGFFPTSWLDYFFKDSRDLLNIKKKRQKGEQVIETSIDRMLDNIELLPELYEYIKRKQVISIEYKPYEEEQRTLRFHPHFLKEYNGRWFLLGRADGEPHEFVNIVALDRIVGKIKENYEVSYIPAPAGFYKDFFNDIVGITHLDGAQIQDVHIRAHTLNMFRLTETKKIHKSQVTIKPFGQYEDGKYGEFSIKVAINKEFLGRILQMGEDLEIISPPEVRQEIKEKVNKLNKLYYE